MTGAADDPRVFAPPLRGAPYHYVLGWLHEGLRPRTYFEIGMLQGLTFRLARCPAIGVDPVVRLPTEALTGRPSTMLFEMSSDSFFDAHSPSALFGAPVDFAFLDGLHVFEALLRDFINTERHCRRHSVIALHDCVPTALGMARGTEFPQRPEVSREPGDWTGDVWKILPVLRKYRPDLRIHVLDAAPTGLVLVTGLDPENTVLSERYWAILDECQGMDLATIGVSAFVASQHVVPSEPYADLTFRARHFTV